MIEQNKSIVRIDIKYFYFWMGSYDLIDRFQYVKN